ncbi:nucleoside diphosphate kinase Ecym_2294 [Eremothecium cymbalariae DBVPG|uniref:Nucleoside diphosphate kinase n=1 Tax=Eremothecium cymbalariae (strain CBS 270.75 / DBVPG 7215 / KCTC 17166 / NRRL Y-17582) TaxID=931890 RepID=G8JQ34_ERECY|nr:Hypothetical protein Ecym_2294 [Eremothecium cymbalariae DBVPG\
MSDQTQRTFIAVKPDGVQRGLISQILARFENRGYKLVGIKMIVPTEALLREHYAEHVDRPFFPKLLAHMTSGPVAAMVWEGSDVVAQGRTVLGATNPSNALPGTIRGDFGIDMGRNVCHGSDSVASAEREINLWFKKEELADWTLSQHKWIYE